MARFSIFGPKRTRLAPSASGHRAGVALVAVEACQSFARHVGAQVNVFPAVNTNSMLPAIDANSFVLIERVAFDQIAAGDWIVYQASTGNRVLHVANDLTPRGWRMWGLNNSRPDHGYCTAENLLGRYCGSLVAQKSHDTDQ